MPSYNGLNTAKAQAFLYCTGSAAGSSSCHNGGAAQTDAINFHLKPGGTSLTAEAQMDQWVSATQAVLQPAEFGETSVQHRRWVQRRYCGMGCSVHGPEHAGFFHSALLHLLAAKGYLE